MSLEHQRARCGTDSLRSLLSIFRRLVYLHYFYLDGICQPNTLQIISSRFKLVQAKTHNQTSSRCWHSRIERELESILSLIASTFSGQRALSFDRQRVQIVVLNVSWIFAFCISIFDIRVSESVIYCFETGEIAHHQIIRHASTRSTALWCETAPAEKERWKERTA